MGRTYIIHYHPFSLHDWMHEHQWFVRSSFGLIIATLALAVAAPTVSLVRDAIAEQIEPFAQEAEVVSPATLPREWSRSPKPISFDHMYRQSDAPAVLSYTRDASRKYYRSSSE